MPDFALTFSCAKLRFKGRITTLFSIKVSHIFSTIEITPKCKQFYLLVIVIKTMKFSIVETVENLGLFWDSLTIVLVVLLW